MKFLLFSIETKSKPQCFANLFAFHEKYTILPNVKKSGNVLLLSSMHHNWVRLIKQICLLFSISRKEGVNVVSWISNFWPHSILSIVYYVQYTLFYMILNISGMPISYWQTGQTQQATWIVCNFWRHFQTNFTSILWSNVFNRLWEFI